MTYPHLTAPLKLPAITLRNRVIMGSMHTGMENRQRDLPRLAAYFAERARGGVGLIVTGGYAPNRAGWLSPFASDLRTAAEADRQRRVTDAVHAEGGAIALQVLHAGRYGYHPFVVSASAGKSPISPFPARELSARAVRKTIRAFATTAALAREAGYDGVEIMGSEGYLINQFLAARTNRRTDEWGGSPENRRRFATEIVRATRAAVGADFLVIYRMSLIDLVPDGQTWDDVLALGREVEAAGASMITTGIGWHEARVPTVVTSVPRAAFAGTTAKLRPHLGIPVAAANRINTPQVAEDLLAAGVADLVQMARPLLADPEWVNKAAAGAPEQINTCIACNQACLDHIFVNRRASCLVNPRAGRETDLVIGPVHTRRRVAVVGAGVAGLACATTAASRGHEVELFEASQDIGGQFDLARRIPGKEEFAETLRYYRHELSRTGVKLTLGHRATPMDLLAGGFDHIVVATGVHPRMPVLQGIDHPMVLAYDEALKMPPTGTRVAIIGAGGVGVDVAEFLTHSGPQPTPVGAWQREWGISDAPGDAGGLTEPQPPRPARTVYLLQRSEGRIGTRLGRTSGWVHRATLKARDVIEMTGVSYQRVDDAGLHIIVDGTHRLLEVDNVVVCAGQEPRREIYDALIDAAAAQPRPPAVHVVGGADRAAELDAKRAILHATRLAARL